MLTIADIAAKLRLSKGHVQQRVVCLPDFPKRVNITGHPRWFEEDVNDWLRERQAENWPRRGTKAHDIKQCGAQERDKAHSFGYAQTPAFANIQ